MAGVYWFILDKHPQTDCVIRFLTKPKQTHVSIGEMVTEKYFYFMGAIFLLVAKSLVGQFLLLCADGGTQSISMTTILYPCHAIIKGVPCQASQRNAHTADAIFVAGKLIKAKDSQLNYSHLGGLGEECVWPQRG